MRLKVNNPDDVAAVIPHMLGFAPRESLVVMPMGSDLPVARIDLPRTPQERSATTESLLNPYLRNAGPNSKVALVVFSDSGQAAEDASLQLAQELTAHGLPVGFRLWVTDQTWTDLGTGHGGVRTQDAQTRMAALFVADGRRTPAQSREELHAAFAGDRAAVAAKLGAAEAAAAKPGQSGAERAWAADRIDTFERDGNRLSDADTARLLVAVQHVATRDDALMRITRENCSQHRALWTDVTSRAPQQVRTPAATITGFSAWLNGDGAGAWTALDQIKVPPQTTPTPGVGTPGRPPEGESDHQYALAGMLAQLIEEGVNPAVWDSRPRTPATPGAREEDAFGASYDPPDLTTNPADPPRGPSRLPDPPNLGDPPSNGPGPTAR